MQKKLIIWDFDGVIADSEHLWVKNWTSVLQKQKSIFLSPEQQKYYLEGKADKTKIELLQKDFPDLRFGETFWRQIQQNEDKLIAQELTITDKIEDILQDQTYAHCVATGANPEKHFKKVFKLRLDKYFTPQNSFTAYQVKQGKPAPDLFLYAARQMGFSPQDCLIIEDSLAGITAGKAAGIPVIAYIGATGNNSEAYAEKCKNAGAAYICCTMDEVRQTIKQHFS